ncbi:MAG: LuxR family transcriptional regulator [Rickettsiales bacterium]|nr:LuxR family transcriptional regulator [Rickettsiales bacterium]
MWVDSHVNFEDERLKSDLDGVLERAYQQDILYFLNICSKIKDFPEIIGLANSHDNIWASVGTHPHHSGEDTETPVTTDDIVKLVNDNERVIAIGETGLDYYYNHSEPDAQRASFRKHIRACVETELPMIIHARDADQEIQDIIEEEAPNGQLKGILHCYASGRGLAEWGVNYGLYVSFSGIVTFKNANDIKEIAKEVVPLERLLIETDAPYLAPVPKRGRVCEPSLLIHTAEYLADLKGVDLKVIEDYTTSNFFKLFKRAKR